MRTEFARDLGRGGRVIHKHGVSGHALKGTVWPNRDGPQIIVVAHTGHDQIRMGSGQTGGVRPCHLIARMLRLPGLRAVLVALCQPLQCQVGMPRRIEAVRIDASNFTRLPPEAFRLQLTLANSDSIPVAMPAIELTLTDTQDQPILRRVLQPADLGPGTPEALPAAGEWSASVTLTVSPAAAGSVAGYRLLAFYP